MFNFIKRQLGVSKPQKTRGYHVDIFVNHNLEDAPHRWEKNTFEVDAFNPEEAVLSAIMLFKDKFSYRDCSGELSYRVDEVYEEIYYSKKVEIPCLSKTNVFVHHPLEVSS